MIRRIQALRYRCLRYVEQELAPFQVLVGANATGKTTFLDVVAFLHDLLAEGLDEAVGARTHDFHDLLWRREGRHLELAVEAAVPSELRKRLTRNGDDASLYEEVRYEVAIGLGDSDTLTILGETLWLTPGDRPASHQPGPKQLSFFPQEPEPPEYVALPESHHAPSGWRRVVSKKASSGNDYFQAETTKWNNLFRFGAQKLALANLPEDAIYPLNLADDQGQPLDGRNNYAIHFERDQLPPAGAFWSITLYDNNGFQVANSLNRFAVSSWMPFQHNADGSLDLYFQNESPGKDMEANWLPAPDGPYNLTMRLYAPKPEALTGKWNPPAVVKASALPAIAAQ